MTMVPSSSSGRPLRRLRIPMTALGALAVVVVLISLPAVSLAEHHPRFSLLPQPSWGGAVVASRRPFLPTAGALLVSRGGYQDDGAVAEAAEEEISLDEKVRRAMIKLGLTPPADDGAEGGVEVAASSVDQQADEATPEESSSSPVAAAVASADAVSADASDAAAAAEATEAKKRQLQQQQDEEDAGADAMATRLAADFGVDRSLAMAAIGATRRVGEEYDETGARELLRQEVDRIAEVSEDSEAVQTLVGEGFDPFMSRRALAFADLDLDDARAILLADQMDQEEDAARDRQQQQEEEEEEEAEAEPLKTVTINTDFDPTSTQPQQETPQATAASPAAGNMPKPAQKADVVFEATAAQIQELVLESPVPVLLDCYADWCGPCKALGPVLEEMAVKSGGVFRLVKLNTDNEQAVSKSLGVTALPTIFGIRDGKVLNMFQGMPRSEKAMQSFMMGLLMGESNFDPQPTEEEKKTYRALTLKLAKVGGAACFSFSARERLQDRVQQRLDELAEQAGDFVDAEESTRVLRSLLSNVIKDPYDPKYRTVNLQNKVIAKAIGQYPASLAILKSVGFQPPSDGDDSSLALKKKVINVAPLLVTRDSIDKWTDQTRNEVAKATRKRKDEADHDRLRKEAAERGDDDDEEEEEEEIVENPDACTLKLRMEGKKKVHEISLRADDPLRTVLKQLPAKVKKGQEVQITCVAKRLVAKSTDKATMSKSLRELGLTPSASVVVAVGSSSSSSGGKEQEGGNGSSSSLSQRAAKQKKKKTGSHTMQSIGIYAKDDNNKAELIDGGGGVLYEHDVTDDEEEAAEPEKAAEEEENEEESPDENGDDEDDLEDEDV